MSALRIRIAGFPVSIRFTAIFCFILSGVASISYQIIWLRQAMTYFGVITPTISAVLSIFMLGLALGTYVVGKMSGRLTAGQAIRYYIYAELAICITANLVPYGFHMGYELLLAQQALTSGTYLLLSILVMTLIMLPTCTLLGATFPLMMRFLYAFNVDEKNFSHLYFANLIGALIGCLLPLVLIEAFGFSGALHTTAFLNFMVAVVAMQAFLKKGAGDFQENPHKASIAIGRRTIGLNTKAVLFITGFFALGSEVVWVRVFAPALGTTVYAFAVILALYLASTFVGTRLYISGFLRKAILSSLPVLLPVAALLPVFTGTHEYKNVYSVLTIIPVCLLLGYLMPWLIDEAGSNDPQVASRAYCYNFAGCILGPLFTTYLLFPFMGSRDTLLLYAFLLAVVPLILAAKRLYFAVTLAAMLLVSWAGWDLSNIEKTIRSRGVLSYDHVGYIGAVGKGMKKNLLVNGVGMTHLTTITKNMAHMPLIFRPQSKSALVICMGMGTTLRSLTRWPLEHITVVELSRGVINSFPYFYSDAAQILRDPRVEIIEDDGRRFLNRSEKSYDVITLDPPPPVSASGSGLLYTSEFIGVAKSKLTEGGVLAHWLPRGDALLRHAVVNAFYQHFKYVSVYHSLEGWGIHILASDSPLSDITPHDFLAALPDAAVRDLKEWHMRSGVEYVAFNSVMRIPREHILLPGYEHVFMSDNHLYNEFYMLRQKGLIHAATQQ